MSEVTIPNVNTANTTVWNPIKPGGGIESFVPAMWNAGILMSFFETALAPYITTRPDEIEGGMIIYNWLNEVEVNDYNENDSVSYDGLSTKPITFPIDTTKSWAFKVTDIQKRQSKNGSFVTKAIVSAGRQMQKSVDTDLLKAMVAYTKLKGKNLGTITISADNIYDHLVNIDTEMDKQDMPEEGRYCVINHDMMGMLRKDPRFTFQEQVLRNGNMQGSKVANLTIYTTNRLPEVAATKDANPFVDIIAGIPQCWGFGAQLTESEKLRSGTNFADLYRGLYLYGEGSIRGENLITANVELDVSVNPTLGVIEA